MRWRTRRQHHRHGSDLAITRDNAEHFVRSEVLQCYRAREHVLLFDVQPKSLVLLTVIHGGRDFPSRLRELLPTLTAEVEILHGKLSSRRKK